MIRSRSSRRFAPAAFMAALAACGPAPEERRSPQDVVVVAPQPPPASAGPPPSAVRAPGDQPVVVDTRDYARVDDARLAAADDEPGQWMSHGRTYEEQRFSPLDTITTDNVATLGLNWFADLDTNRGQAATPVVVDGVIYIATAWSKVAAFDAATGEPLWSYDPQVPQSWSINACCDVINRGVAVWGGKVFVATLDGLLVALDASTGRPIWQVNTLPAETRHSITGAPRVVKGRVLIGNDGTDFGVRGYVSAYDAETGALDWRFWTVPGDPADGFETPEMALAAETWSGAWWRLGGGGAPWDAIVYDPRLDLVFIGVGAGSPWHHKLRSPRGGDNLFLSSVVAVDPDDGSYVWHYQTTPGETWNYAATQPIILADLVIGGDERRVLMQAPKNGFFYVLDAATGALISANNYVPVNWAEGIDLETGRPIEVPEARWSDTGVAFVATPGPMGGHSWHAMAFNPATGLVYLPIQDTRFPYIPDGAFEPRPLGANSGVDLHAAALPQSPAIKERALAKFGGALIAWDPVAQAEVWRVTHTGPSNGGALTTAGGLVFQGNGSGELVAYDAVEGTRLWSRNVQTGVLAAPVSYEVEGEQYIALVVGTGGAWATAPGEAGRKGGGLPNISRLLAFKLGGRARLPAPPPRFEPPLNPPPATADGETVLAGARHYAQYCGMCHGDAAVSAGMISDLRHSATLHEPDAWDEVVREGILSTYGMVSFAQVLDREGSDAVRAYVIARATEDAEREGAGDGVQGMRP